MFRAEDIGCVFERSGLGSAPICSNLPGAAGRPQIDSHHPVLVKDLPKKIMPMFGWFHGFKTGHIHESTCEGSANQKLAAKKCFGDNTLIFSFATLELQD